MRADVSQVAVRVANLRVIRGGVAVIDDLSFKMPTGEVIGLLGPSGCGEVDADAVDRRGPDRRFRGRWRFSACPRIACAP